MKRGKERPAALAHGSAQRRALWMRIGIIIAAFLAFGQVIGNDFTWWDDHQTIHQNPHLNPPAVSGLAHYWRHEHMGLYAPVTYTLWWLLASVAHLAGSTTYEAAWLFHLASVLVHAVAGVVAFALLRRLLPLPSPTDELHCDWAALLGALTFMLHPVQVEAVAWGSGMKDLLFGFFGLVALWQYVRFAGSANAPDTKRRLAYAAALAAAGLSMLSKPTGVVIPIAAAAIDWLCLRRPLRRALITVATMLAMAVAVAVIARVVQPAHHVEGSALWARPLIVGDSLAFYLAKVLWPVGLAVDYGRRPTAVLGSWWGYVAWVIPAAIALTLVLRRPRRAELSTAGLLFVTGALPVLGFLSFEFQGYSTVADHYLYLSMLGLSLAVAWIVSRYWSAGTIAAAVAVLLILAVRTIVQSTHWKNDQTLWTHNLHVNPRSWLAHTNLGAHLDRLGDAANVHGRALRQRGDTAGAAAAYRERDRLHHDAAAHYRQALALNPHFLTARHSLANYCFYYDRFTEAADEYRRLIDSASKLPPAARPPLGDVYHRLGVSLARSGRPAEAADAFAKALAENPQHPTAAQDLQKLHNPQ